jgi:hypothetical protein
MIRPARSDDDRRCHPDRTRDPRAVHGIATYSHTNRHKIFIFVGLNLSRCSILRIAFMTKENCLIVRAAGRQLDLLRGEASRIAKDSKMDWWIDHADVGSRFCFEDAKAKEAFAVTCDSFGIPCRDG